MPKGNSPLRYPGGKTCLYPIVSKIIRDNKLQRRHYVEPFAGGCGLALTLLFEGHVSDIHINDIDPSIWAFWQSVLEHTDELVARIQKTPVDIAQWRIQRDVHLKMNMDDPVSLGFATFFLNRTNRSGIIKAAGVIGGLAQKGRYKLDCRFNRDDLERRIRRVAKYKDRIHLTRLDALDFIPRAKKNLPEETFYCVDPPYFSKGQGLYTSFYDPSDHKALADKILKLQNPWIVTYDKAEVISSLYRRRRQFEFDINYSVETKRIGTELLIASKGLRIPCEIRDRQVRPQHNSAAAA